MSLAPDQTTELLPVRGSVSEEEMLHLHRLAAEVRDGCIVEVGRFVDGPLPLLRWGRLRGTKYQSMRSTLRKSSLASTEGCLDRKIGVDSSKQC